ncbi:MAG: Na/Pi cotransporter family protein [Clostridia bacterium]|nr:Na/Pi cotransporter family protein [Clostridia bacterium]
MLASILNFIAGIGVFLFSMKMLSGSLEDLCGNSIRKGFSKIGSNRLSNFGLGFIVTAILQSSTASVLMTIGFTATGMLTLFQALAIDIGANLGSAIAPFIVSFSSFNIIGFFCALAGLGAFMHIFAKKNKTKKIANVIFAFALIFIGLELMSSATSVFKTNEAFLSFFTNVTNPILLILIGTLFAALIQSSLGALAVLMTLIGTATIPGAITFESAVFLVYGANLGTVITTALFGSLTPGEDSKRISLFHLLNRLIGVVVFACLYFTPWLVIFDWISEPAIKIAMVNFIFNLVNSLIFLPLIKPSMWVLKKLIPNRKSKTNNELEIEIKDGEQKTVSIARATDKTKVFFNEYHNIFAKTLLFIKEEQLTDFKNLTEEISNFITLNQKLNKFIVQISFGDDAQEANYIDKLLLINRQIDRNAGTLLKMLNAIKDEKGKKFVFSIKLTKQLTRLEDKINDLVDLCWPYVNHPDFDFKDDGKPNITSIVDVIQEISTIKLNVKTNLMKNGFNSKLSVRKNSSYLSLLNYMTSISNNFLDFAFAIESDYAPVDEKTNYEQIDIDSLEDIDNLSKNLQKNDEENA